MMVISCPKKSQLFWCPIRKCYGINGKVLQQKSKEEVCCEKEKIVKKFNKKCFIYNKIEHLAKDCRNKDQFGNPKRRIA
jgi:hypothetical protein